MSGRTRPEMDHNSLAEVRVDDDEHRIAWLAENGIAPDQAERHLADHGYGDMAALVRALQRLRRSARTPG